MAPKTKVLIGYNYHHHYRVPLFNFLAERYDLTIFHSGKPMKKADDLFKEVIFEETVIGPFHWQKNYINVINKEKYDVVVALFDVAWISTLLSFFLQRSKTKYILWGAWITKNKYANLVRLYLAKMAYSNIYYTVEAMTDFINLGLDPKTLFVANNTFDVGSRVKSYLNEDKFRILFVGSLDKRKQIDILINAYNTILNQIPLNVVLTIIGGGGTEESNLKDLVNQLNLNKRVEFLGSINDPEKLKKYYEESIVNVSFGQAGLSVLQSLGYGVPFLTKINAISGGEKSNIKDRYNSVFCEDNIESLCAHLKKLCNDLEYSKKLGENGFNYYSEFCTIENMGQGFIDAIEQTRIAKIDNQ